MQKIYHKRNELLAVEFFKDKECTNAFDFTDAKNLYIELKDGDLAALFMLSQEFNKFLDNENERQYLYIPYLPSNYKTLDGIKALQRSNYGTKALPQIKTLADITDFSKYIPEDNAVLFFDENISLTYFQDCLKYGFTQFYRYGKKKLTFAKHTHTRLQQKYIENYVVREVCDKENEVFIQHKKITIFIPHGTLSELQKASEVAKELKEKYGVEEVNVFVLHCFVLKRLLIKTIRPSKIDRMYDDEIYGYKMQKICNNIDKIITTNSTGLLEPQDNEKLQVIDCFDIFNDAL